MARPPKAQESIDKDELENLMKFSPTCREVADWFNVSENSIVRFIKNNFNLSFEELRNKSFVKTRMAIKRAQISKALKGDNVMLIWCGKQYLGQSDKVLDEDNKPSEIKVNITKYEPPRD